VRALPPAYRVAAHAHDNGPDRSTMSTTLSEVAVLARALPRDEREQLVIELAESLSGDDAPSFRPASVRALLAELAAAEIEHSRGDSMSSDEVRRRLQQIREGRSA
jgi:hypothetical protein